jgi:hypothetical protein
LTLPNSVMALGEANNGRLGDDQAFWVPSRTWTRLAPSCLSCTPGSTVGACQHYGADISCWAILTMVSTLRVTSSSVVAQELTLIRMAGRPC